jgi:hypothetical protein
MSQLRFATPDIRLASADAFAVVAAFARVERKGCKAKQGRRGKTALTCGSYSQSSTVLGCRPEREKNSLVTITARFCSSSHPAPSLFFCGLCGG